ncbi:hypothetical protein HQ447_15255, partial [bacterium]|nr:hypothetical protein [bacterium]
LKPMTKVPGNTDRIEKSIEISPETIAAVEAGDLGPPPVIAALPPAPAPTAIAEAQDEAVGETGEEIGEMPPEAPPLSTTVIPTPTITPEVDAEGSVIPKAIPIKEN